MARVGARRERKASEERIKDFICVRMGKRAGDEPEEGEILGGMGEGGKGWGE